MATRTAIRSPAGEPVGNLRRRVEIALEAVALMLGDLPEVVDQWPQLSDGERAAWSLDWDQVVLDDLPLLARQDRADQLTPAQQERFRALRLQLTVALPLLQQVGLLEPQIPLEAGAPSPIASDGQGD